MSIFAIFCILFIHTLACIWIFIAGFFEDDYDENWLMAAGFNGEESSWKTYWLGSYFVVTTITTVGFGDHSGKNTSERILGMVTMILGVVAFSYATGMISSFI